MHHSSKLKLLQLKPLYLALALMPGFAFGIGQTTRVSVDAAGLAGNKLSADGFISANGRFVAFSSLASNLVSGDTNNHSDVFVKDRQTGQITRVSVNSLGEQGLDDSGNPWISQDGKLVAFTSYAWNLVPGGTGLSHLYFHDMTTGATTLIPVAPDSFGHIAPIVQYSVSADGRFVAYQSNSKLPNSGCKN